MRLTGENAQRSPSGRQRGDLLARLNQARTESLRASIGPQHFGVDGRLRVWRSCLLPGLDEDLLRRCGIGAMGRLRHPESSAALAINSFLSWHRCPHLLALAGHCGFRELRFEARCPTGVRGTPPLLDMVAMDDQVLVAVTARAVEYLAPRRTPLAVGYDQLRVPAGLQPWMELRRRLRDEPRLFRHVDVPALVKHALGLGQNFPNRAVSLLYLFWEPLGVAEQDPFRLHRAELRQLSAMVEGSTVAVAATSFHELWSEWERLAEPEWLRGIAARLKARYGVAMASVG